eukprot:SAG11_NODE_4400_length_1911_cov_1.211369_2_plen_51_part_00
MPKHTGVLGAMVLMVHEGGVLSLWRGLLPELVRGVTFQAVMMGSKERIEV